MPDFSLAVVCGLLYVALSLPAIANAGGDHRVPFAAGRAHRHVVRPHVYDLVNVKIVATLDESSRSVSGDVTNTIRMVQAGGRSIDLDASGLRFTRVSLAGGPSLRYETQADFVRVYLPQPAVSGQTYAIETRYQARPIKGLYFEGPDKFYPRLPREVWSQGEPEDNHYWFPTYDNPDRKAQSETVITVPEGQLVISNGSLAHVTHDRIRRTATFDWVESVPHSTYLISIVAGEFAQASSHAGPIPVTYNAPADAIAKAAFTLRATPDMIKFFSDFNGVPYPYEKFAQSVVTNFLYGGMENVSAVTLNGRSLHDRRSELDADGEGLIAHELAHQWWGDLVTGADWGQFWLNEGYAEYYTMLYAEHAHGVDRFDIDRRDDQAEYFRNDARYRRPIVTQMYGDPFDMADDTTYDKGALVLHMLRTMVGTDTYQKAQTAFLTQYREKPVDTTQWQAAMEQASGKELGWFTSEWLYKAGFPEYSVSYRYDATTNTIRVAVDQTQKTAWNTPAVFVMPITIALLDGDGTPHPTLIQNDKRRQVFTIAAPAKPVAVLFDPGHTIVSKVRFPRGDDELAFIARKAPSVFDRLDAFDALIAPAKPDIQQFAAAETFLAHDPVADARAYAAAGFAKFAPDPRAASALRQAMGDPSAHVRAAAAKSLALFGSDISSVAALNLHASYDPSYAVIANSVESLATSKAAGADAVLAKALQQTSDKGVIAAAALRGYAKLKGADVIPLEEQYARYGAPLDTRDAAITALGEIGKGHAQVTQFLGSLLGDPNARTNRMIVSALADLGDRAGIPYLQRYAQSAKTSFQHRAALEAIAVIEGKAPRAPRNP